MKSICFRIFALLFFSSALAFGANPSVPQEGGKQYAEVISGNNALIAPSDRANPLLYGGPEVAAIKGWGVGSPNSKGLGEIFTLVQGHYFALIFLLVIIFVPMAFYGHLSLIHI